MLLTVTTTHRPATDLGYLLAKNPANWHEKPLAFGNSIVFFPQADEERCSATLMLDIDPVALSRRQGAHYGASPLEPYVNDRPYAASSFLSVAIAKQFGSALKGRSRERQVLADQPLPFEVDLPVLPARGGERLLRALFEPLGYHLNCRRLPLDEQFPGWGGSRYFALTLRHTVRLADLLSHLYVLIPVLDDAKHYWVGDDELAKLLATGEQWLKDHPSRELITERYLRRDRRLVSEALRRLSSEEDPRLEARETRAPLREEALERPLSLNQRRIGVVRDTLKAVSADSVLDLGCGEGKLLRALASDRQFARMAGADVSPRALAIAAKRLRLDQMSERQRQRFTLFQASAVYRDQRFADFDAIALIEVIEHLDASRLPALESVVFEFAAPRCILVTTPNRDYNSLFESLPDGRLRHADHRFEWSRAEFADWAGAVAERHGYRVTFSPIGERHSVLGAPTQMALFQRGIDETPSVAPEGAP